MSDHMSIALDEFAAELSKDGIIDADEVSKIKERIYADSKIDKEEADFLFKLNDACSCAENDSSWEELFIQGITDYVTKDEKSPGVVDADEASYIMEKVKGDGKVDGLELRLLVNIVASSTDCASSLVSFTQDSLKSSILEDGLIDDDEVALLKGFIFGSGGGDGEGVSREEADFLFELNDACSGKNNSPKWKELFVEALSRHLLEDEKSPGVIDQQEAQWLVNKVEGDGSYDENEKALLLEIKQKAKEVDQKLKFKLDLLSI